MPKMGQPKYAVHIGLEDAVMLWEIGHCGPFIAIQPRFFKENLIAPLWLPYVRMYVAPHHPMKRPAKAYTLQRRRAHRPKIWGANSNVMDI